MGRIHVVVLTLFVGMLSLGQILFKLSALRNSSGGMGKFLTGLMSSGSFYLALVTYGAATLLWIWVLREVPLSKAYPFTILSFIITPLLSVYFFDEVLSIRYFIGGIGLLVSLVVMNG
jgi:undecaprenyl phosphate-alpha-L-ara4N flippase subunit ArnE